MTPGRRSGKYLIWLVVLSAGLSGCKSQARKDREQYEAALTSVQAELDTLKKVAAADVTPKCQGRLDKPTLALDRDGPVGVTLHFVLTGASKHPCAGLQNEDVEMLLSPFENFRVRNGAQSPETNQYVLAIERTKRCFAGIELLAVTSFVSSEQRVAQQDEKSEVSFRPGDLVSDVRVFTRQGVPVCKARLKTSSDAFALVEKGNEDRSLADALYNKHVQTLNWWLGPNAQ